MTTAMLDPTRRTAPGFPSPTFPARNDEREGLTANQGRGMMEQVKLWCGTMAAFLLWNVHRKPLDALVQALVRAHKIEGGLAGRVCAGGQSTTGDAAGG
jgi:hypothetical protein